MSRIAAELVAREAIVYVRQSTVDQVINNGESRRRQYGLVERARQLGWAKVSVIDDDLGRSGSGVSRPGFEKLLAAIWEGRVGVVISIEASRLARNGRDWHAGRSNWRSSRRVSKRRTPDGSMTPSIPTTDWLPENWSGVGTSA